MREAAKHSGRKWKTRSASLALAGDLAEPRRSVRGIMKSTFARGEHDALGLAAGARRIDDGDRVGGGDGVQPGLARLGLEHLVERRDATVFTRPRRRDRVGELARAREQQRRLRAAQHHRELLRLLLVVERHDDRTARECREIGTHPAHGVRGENRDAVAGLHARAGHEGARTRDEVEQRSTVALAQLGAVDLDDRSAFWLRLEVFEDALEEVAHRTRSEQDRGRSEGPPGGESVAARAGARSEAYACVDPDWRMPR